MTLPTSTSTPEYEAYCVKCKGSRKMADVQIISTKNGKPAAKGKCPVCGTTMMKFLSSKTVVPAAPAEATPPAEPTEPNPSTNS